MNIGDREILIWLNSLNIGNYNISKLIQIFPNLGDLWYIDKMKLENMNLFSQANVDKIFKNRNLAYLEKLFLKIEGEGVEILTLLDQSYPRNLMDLEDKPNVIWSKGSIIEEDNLAIGIVGSRKSTNYGKWAAEKFSRELVQLGITVVSGLANGIDTIAHRSALENGGRTIAVLGTGIDKVYPSKNKGLYREIEGNGAVITEFPLGTQPFAYNFPQRNRIISGLSLGILVIEAQEKSGTLITASHAANQGRDVFALPGNINSIFSQGTNRLIRDGAIPLVDIDNVLEEIYQLSQLKRDNTVKNKVNPDDFSDLEIRVINCIQEEAIHCDEISYKTGIDIGELMSILTILELKGIVRELSGRIFTIL